MLQVLTRPFQSTNTFSCREGVFWLLVAVVAEIPPVVSLKSFSVVDILLKSMYQVFIILNLNGIPLRLVYTKRH